MTAAQIIDAVISQCGTDTTRANVLSILNEQYATQVADSRWYRTTASIGVTVVGQTQYPVPDGLIEAFGVKIDSYPLAPIGDDAMWAYRAGQATVRSGVGGVFAQSYNSAGQLVIDLQLAPDTAGTAILVYAAMQPPALTDAPVTPITPADTHSSLIDGTAALVLMRVDERPDLAGPHQARFEARTEALRRRRNTMLRGAGPLQFQISGKHF